MTQRIIGLMLLCEAIYSRCTAPSAVHLRGQLISAHVDLLLLNLFSQSALDDLEQHIQPFLEAAPKQITAQVLTSISNTSSSPAGLLHSELQHLPPLCMLQQNNICNRVPMMH